MTQNHTFIKWKNKLIKTEKNKVVKPLIIIVFLSLTLLVYSCSTIRLKNRNGLDTYLDNNSYNKLCGNFKNSKIDTIKYHKSLYSNFNHDSFYNKKELIVNITPIDNKSINLKILDNQNVIDSLTIRGKYRRGYFKMNRQWSTNFIAGPLLWVLGDNLMYLGLTKENKLVVIESGSGGVMLFVALPIFSVKSGQFENEYELSE